MLRPRLSVKGADDEATRCCRQSFCSEAGRQVYLSVDGKQEAGHEADIARVPMQLSQGLADHDNERRRRKQDLVLDLVYEMPARSVYTRLVPPRRFVGKLQGSDTQQLVWRVLAIA
ncbi:hypothetical protein XA68_17372 [Ophiocordyceps unilateralis]|uniref:Uncharacterized protein n=1 Tax=Ophiocordyceps unilateralis TaxID=268505 RepID=A0A2A9P373_OPHUN|nr:hypothetical protein XA68_17372 [Ophiocordyceps unilateralis]